MKNRILLQRTLYVLIVLALVLLPASSANSQSAGSSYPVPALLVELSEGEYSTNTMAFQPINEKLLFFAAEDYEHGYEPWVTDGTPQGTHILKDIWQGMESSMETNSYTDEYEHVVAVLDSNVYFFAMEPSGYSLWKTGGTPETTIKVLDTEPCGLLPMDGLMYLIQGSTLAVTDGTQGNIRMIGEMSQGKWPYSRIIGLRSQFFFFTRETDTQTNDQLMELWSCSTTGCATEPIMLWRVPSEIEWYPWMLFSPRKANNLFFFSAYTPESGFEIWQSDGTASGTVMVQDMNPGSGSMLPYTISATEKGFFFAGAPGSIYGSFTLYFTAGKNAGGIQAIQTDISPLLGIVIGQHQYFYPYKEGDTSTWLARTDGTKQGTQVFRPAAGDHRASFEVAELRSTVFFSAYVEALDDLELFIMPGQPSATSMYADVRPGEEGSHPEDFYMVNNRVIFTADDGIHGRELWYVDLFSQSIFLPQIKR